MRSAVGTVALSALFCQNAVEARSCALVPLAREPSPHTLVSRPATARSFRSHAHSRRRRGCPYCLCLRSLHPARHSSRRFPPLLTITLHRTCSLHQFTSWISHQPCSPRPGSCRRASLPAVPRSRPLPREGLRLDPSHTHPLRRNAASVINSLDALRSHVSQVCLFGTLTFKRRPAPCPFLSPSRPAIYATFLTISLRSSLPSPAGPPSGSPSPAQPSSPRTHRRRKFEYPHY